MDSILIVVLSLLIWLTSKIIFCFFEIIVIDSSIEKDAPVLKRTLLQKIKYSYRFNKSEIMITVVYMAVSTFLFMALLFGSMWQLNSDLCEYINNHVLYFITFDCLINLSILFTVNYFVTYKFCYRLKMEPLFKQVSIDPKLFGLQ